MLDAGKARDPHIKHIPIFENRAIIRLLKSPHYIGRYYSDKSDLDKYTKNKQICKLIDEIRYDDGIKKIKRAKKISAKLNNCNFTGGQLNGGGASTKYSNEDKIDLGNSQNDSCLGPVFIPHIEPGHNDDDYFYNGKFPANIHYNFSESQLNGGNARTSYDSGQQIDLGTASYI